MRNLETAEIALISGGKKTKVTPVGPQKNTLPPQSAHGIETATAASSKPKKQKKP
jgi:hypothetical protein